MMSRASRATLNALAEEIFNTIKDDRRVVDCIYLGTQKLHGKLSCKALREVVNEKLNFHGGWKWFRTLDYPGRSEGLSRLVLMTAVNMLDGKDKKLVY